MPDLGPVIEAAIDLAWRPFCNIATPREYRARVEAHERLVACLRGHNLAALPADLRRAIRRAAACSFSNRRGEPYMERKQAVMQLRGALTVFLGGAPR